MSYNTHDVIGEMKYEIENQYVTEDPDYINGATTHKYEKSI